MVWDLETGKEIHRFEGHGDRVMCVQFDERKIGTSYLFTRHFPPPSFAFLGVSDLKKHNSILVTQ